MRNTIQKGLKYLSILVLFAFVVTNALPNSMQPAFLQKIALDKDYSLGLDLQGGSQLDFKIDLREVEEKDHKTVLDGILQVINKRVNSLGVNEPNIYLSNIGPEKHIVVELAGIKDINEAKNTVGKTIQLEFKEENLEVDPKITEERKTIFDGIYQSVSQNVENFQIIGEQESKANSEFVNFSEINDQKIDDIFIDDVKNLVQNQEIGTVSKLNNELSLGLENSLRPVVQQGFLATKLIDRSEREVETNIPKEVKVSHILISHNETTEKLSEISKGDAKAKADDLLSQIIADNSKFDSLGEEFSDDSLSLNEPVVEGSSTYVAPFTQAALELKNTGEILNKVVETEFGYHILRAEEVKESFNKKENKTFVTYQQIFVSSTPSQWKETELTGRYLKNAFLSFDQQNRPQVSIVFDNDGSKLFEELTGKNIGKQIAIFVGGAQISAPRVNEAIAGGQAVINGNFTFNEASELARDLKTGALPAPITLTSQYTIGPNLGKVALDTSMTAGLIGLGLLAIFMIFMYGVKGILASVALGLYSIILLFVLKASIPSVWPMLVSFVIYTYVSYQILYSKEDGFEKFVSFIVATFGLFFLSSLLANPVVLTLAGIAGIVLSIGMAVDANVLIFERIKEEYSLTENYELAVSEGFKKAWSSIRDSNYSSLITCAILYFFGSSIIRGFALNLALGIYVSMFSAIVISGTLLKMFKPKTKKALCMFGLKAKRKVKTFKFIQNQKITSGISIALILFSLVSFATKGLNLGIDFKGGSVIELQLSENSDQEALSQTIASFNETNELKDASVVSIQNDAYQIKADYLSEEQYQSLIEQIKTELSTEVQENKFETIGASVSESLKSKAVFSLIIALLAIILYIAISFRKIPRKMQPIKFGYAAIIALFHDVIIILGLFSFFQLEINALFITALLTIIGFSVHDTIVVFDRLRENLIENKKDSVTQIANISLSQTLSRSLNTSLSTVLTLGALYFFGAESLKNLNLALLLGIIVGTYSSIFIATTSLLKISKQK